MSVPCLLNNNIQNQLFACIQIKTSEHSNVIFFFFFNSQTNTAVQQAPCATSNVTFKVWSNNRIEYQIQGKKQNKYVHTSMMR